MKKLLIAIAMLVCVNLYGQSYIGYQVPYQFLTTFTNSFQTNLIFNGTASGVTNAVFTNVIPTIQTLNNTFSLIYTNAGTNGTVINLDRSVDSQNWFPFNTNTFTGPTNYEYTQFIGKWAAYRFRVNAQATNALLILNYIGQ